MIDDISEVPLNESLVISRYIDNPLLINGLKFDMRLYVLVTSFDPLKIYIYNEGLVRFASEPYNTSNIK
jgi:tubulin polyglutamylase TTLL5